MAIGCGVVAGDRRDEHLGVKFRTANFHDFSDRLDSAFGVHHGGGSHLEHLQDVRGIAGAESRYSGGHRLVVLALVGGHDFEITLAGIELLGKVCHPVIERAIHGVPPLNLGLGMGLKAAGEGE